MSHAHDILVVDDEDGIRFVLKHLLSVHGFEVRTATRGEEALQMLQQQRPALVILDIRMPGLSGYEVLKRIRAMEQPVPVILMTALAGVRDAVEAMKAGAFDYIAKPFDNNDMVATVRKGIERAAAAEGRGPQIRLHPCLEELGESPAMRELATALQHCADDRAHCLLRGELGTGKRRLGSLLHRACECEGPLLVLECPGAAESVLRSALYGGGSATGPAQHGLLQTLRDGILLLDGIDEMGPFLQETLANDFSRRYFLHPATGARIDIHGTLLLTSTATDEDEIPEMPLTALMRDDGIRVPPLRERGEDIPSLAAEFLTEANTAFGKSVMSITPTAMEVLQSDPWPGNVHQLKSTIRHAVLLAEEQIEEEHLQIPSLRQKWEEESFLPVTVTRAPLRTQVHDYIAEVERGLLATTLERTGWNKARAARTLGITYKTMLKKVSEYRLVPGKRRKPA